MIILFLVLAGAGAASALTIFKMPGRAAASETVFVIFKNEAREREAKQALVEAGAFDPSQPLEFTGGLLVPDSRAVARFRLKNVPYSATSPVTEETLQTVQAATDAINKSLAAAFPAEGSSCLSYLRPSGGQQAGQKRTAFLADDSICFFPHNSTLRSINKFFAGFPEAQVTRVELPRQVTLEVATKDVSQLISQLQVNPLVARVIRKQEVQKLLPNQRDN